MAKIDTNELIKLEAYYKIKPKSKAREAWDGHWKKRTAAWHKLKKEVAEITGIENPVFAICGKWFSAICIDDPSQLPDGFRLANKKEEAKLEDKYYIYPSGRTKHGRVLKKALDPNRLTKLPDMDELVVDLGLGYGQNFFTINNRLYRGCGYKEEGNNVKINACLFKHKSGKFYYADEQKLVDKLPLVSGLIEIPASQY